VHQAKFDDVAFYVLSSGSTGLSKAVELTHGNLLSRGIGTNILCGSKQSDVILSWLPFDHIGNISAYHISPVLEGSKLVYAQKEFVLARPLRWLDLIHQHRVTHGWAPNFAFALISKAIKAQHDANWDLSCIKGLLSAGELIAYSTVTEFLEVTRPFGLRSDGLISAFGMAETCSGVSYHLPAPGGSIKFVHIDRHHISGAIRHVSPTDPACISFASLGPVIAGMSMRIVDEHNQVVNEDTAGRFQLRGAGLMPGYFQNPQANQAFVQDGWFDTGDAAFITQGELVMLGRVGMGIIVNGANLSNIEIESAAEQIEGVEPSFTTKYS
jgi:acyl-CoA synthetase (AMP-forming)/AMP-acid ligase II